jgi:hypothetical protein
MSGEGFVIRAHTREPRLRDMWNQVSLHLELPPTEIHELKYFNNFIPSYSGIEIDHGKASFKGILNVDSQGVAEQSLLQIAASEIDVKVDEKHLRGELRVGVRLQDVEEADQVFDLAGTSISLDHVFSDTENADWVSAHLPWSGEISIDEGQLSPASDDVFDGRVSMSLLDLRPLLDMYSVRNRMAPWVRSILKVKNVKANASLKIGRKETVLKDLDLKSQGLNLKGWLKVGRGLKRGAILADLGLMSVGLDVNETGTRVILSKVKEWFEARKDPPVE